MTIPQVVDGVTDADAAFMNQLVDAANQANAAFNGAGQITTAAITPALEGYGPLANMRAGIVNVLDSDDVAGDGVSDDTSGIASQLASLTSGGTLVFPAGSVYKGNPATRHVIPADCTVDARGATLVDVLFEPRARSAIIGARFTSAGVRTQKAIISTNNDETAVCIDQCIFDGFDSAVYLQGHTQTGEQQQIGWSVTNSEFLNCSYPLLIIRGDRLLIEGNRFSGNVSGNIMFFGGSRSRVIGNDVDGGVTGIAFIYNRSTSGRFAPFLQNLIASNRVAGFSEEGITFDVRGNSADNIGVVENGTVSATDVSGPTNRIELGASGWGSSPEALYYGYWAMFVTGALAGRVYRITSHPAGTGKFGFSDTDLADAEYAAITVGDRVIIGMPAIGNTIVGNTVDCASSVSEAAEYDGAGIVHWGNAFYSSIVGNTVMGGEITLRSLEGLTTATGSYTGVSGKAPVMNCSVQGNTVYQGNIRFGFKGYGGFAGSPTYQSIGCIAGGNVVASGSMIADAHQVVNADNVADGLSTANGGAFI